MELKLNEIGRLRFASQQLTGTSLRTAADMVTWFAAIQGQEYAQTKWGIGLRMPHLTDGDIEEEFNAGNLLRTHLLRPTWHLVAPKDIRWLLQLTAPRIHAVNAYMYRKLELDALIFNQCNEIIIKSLEGNRHLTRQELNTEFKKNKIVAEGHRLSYILMKTELEGLICSGPRKGKQFTYALLDERAPSHETKLPEEALAELTVRYYSSRGPATIQDFATWSGLAVKACSMGIEAVKSQLTSERLGDKVYYRLRDFPDVRKNDQYFFLPVYDEFIMGYKDRSVYGLFKNSLKPPPPFQFDSMIVENGQIIGTWKRTVKNHALVVEYEMFTSPRKKQLSLLKKGIQQLEKFTRSPVHVNNKN